MKKHEISLRILRYFHNKIGKKSVHIAVTVQTRVPIYMDCEKMLQLLYVPEQKNNNCIWTSYQRQMIPKNVKNVVVKLATLYIYMTHTKDHEKTNKSIKHHIVNYKLSNTTPTKIKIWSKVFRRIKWSASFVAFFMLLMVNDFGD